MNINYAQGIVVLIVLACVLDTNCSKPVEKSSDDKKNNGAVEKMLLNIAVIIQGCIDTKTMNNKDFKIKLDNLYKNLVMPTIQKSIKKHIGKVDDIKKQYEKDIKLLKIMNNMADSRSSKNKDNPSKKSAKK